VSNNVLTQQDAHRTGSVDEPASVRPNLVVLPFAGTEHPEWCQRRSPGCDETHASTGFHGGQAGRGSAEWTAWLYAAVQSDEVPRVAATIWQAPEAGHQLQLGEQLVVLDLTPDEAILLAADLIRAAQQARSTS
jgi:hypothetical protein